MAKKRKKPKFIILRFRKDDPAHNLLAAVQHWVRANGGELILTGGIGVMDEGGSRFRVCVGCLGRQPEKKPA